MEICCCLSAALLVMFTIARAVWIGVPSTSTTMSPTCRPAAAAGDPGRTSNTRTSPVGAVVPVMNATVRMTIARTKFMNTPAARTIACAHQGFEVNDRASPVPCWRIEKSSWPRIRTKPPNGIQLIVYSVSPRRTPQSRGGKPNANSRTFIPRSRAEAK